MTWLSLTGLAPSQAQTAPQPGLIQRGFTVPGLRTVRALDVQADGKILLAGTFTNTPNGTFLVRLAADGSVEWKSAAIQGSPQKLVPGPGGEIFVGGDNTALRYLPPATEPDPTFVAGLGWRINDPWAAVYQPDGSLLVAGGSATAATVDWSTDRSLRNLPIRVLPSGARDTAFFTKVGAGVCTDIAVFPDGSFLAARTDIQRFLADGNPDPAFTPWKATGVEILRRLPSGDILVGGGTLKTFGGKAVKSLFRVSPSGVLDPSFDFAGSFDTVYDAVGAHRPLAVLPDGRFVVGQP
ncbi:MAG: delta-60 repeat domain-containing protein, partial [Verrucomicrobiales bacterium]|nr:delta-60 repeat domain-containing protein [Verrucomicrobiales bacterium]